MILKELSKEQKQYVVLGCLAAGILVILLVLGIQFSMASVTSAKEELADLSDKISKADLALSHSKQISKDYVETISVLRGYLKNAPPDRNYYSWATEVIYSTARFAGLEVDSIDEISVAQLPAGEEGDGIGFESYSLRTTAHGGYESTKYFLRRMKEDYPLVRFAGVEISSGQNPESHDITLFMQWPYNFGNISKDWDAVASQQRMVEDAETDSGMDAEPEPEPQPEPETNISARPIRAKPKPAVEPYPPTTRPGDDLQPRHKKDVSATQPEPNPPVSVPKPATDDELQALLSGGVPPVSAPVNVTLPLKVEKTDPVTEPLPETTPVEKPQYEPVRKPIPEPLVAQDIAPAMEPAPEAVLEQPYEPVQEPTPEPLVEQETAPAMEPAPEAVLEQQPTSAIEAEATPEAESVVDPIDQPRPEPEPVVVPQPDPVVEPEAENPDEQEMFELMSEYDEGSSEAVSEEQLKDAGDAVPAAQPEANVEPASADESPRTYVSTEKSAAIIDELMTKDSPAQDSSLSSFLSGLVEDINDK